MWVIQYPSLADQLLAGLFSLTPVHQVFCEFPLLVPTVSSLLTEETASYDLRSFELETASLDWRAANSLTFKANFSDLTKNEMGFWLLGRMKKKNQKETVVRQLFFSTLHTVREKDDDIF